MGRWWCVFRQQLSTSEVKKEERDCCSGVSDYANDRARAAEKRSMNKSSNPLIFLLVLLSLSTIYPHVFKTTLPAAVHSHLQTMDSNTITNWYAYYKEHKTIAIEKGKQNKTNES